MGCVSWCAIPQIPTKTVQEIIEFYYVWKKCKNYVKWKSTFNQS